MVHVSLRSSAGTITGASTIKTWPVVRGFVLSISVSSIGVNGRAFRQDSI